MSKHLSIKAKLLNIFSIVILFLLFAMLFSSIYIIKNKFDSVSRDLETQVNNLYTEINETVDNTSEEIKNTKENEIKIFLETSSKICDHLIRVEMENLSRKIKIISEKESIQNAIGDNLFKYKSIKKSGKRYYSQNYVKSKMPLKFISLLNFEKTLAWPGREIRAGLELFGKNGTIKARTDIKDDFKEKNNSKTIQEILNSNIYLEISRLVPTDIGITIKVYSRIKNNKTQEIVGGLIGIMPIDNTFADYIKKYTGCEVVIYKENGEFYSTSFFVKGSRFKFKNKPIIFQELYNNPNKIIFEDIIMPSPKNPEKKTNMYKFIFYPILGENENIIGIIALGTNTDSFRNILKTLEKDKNTTFNKFNDTKLSLLNSINKSGKTMLKEFIYIIVIIMTLGVVISVLIFDTILSKFILLTIKKLSKNLKALSEGKSTLKHIKVNSNDEIGQLTNYFNKFIENLKYVIGKIVDSSQIISKASQNINSENNKFIESAVNQSIAIENTSKQIDNINNIIQKHKLKSLDISQVKGDLIFNFEKIKSYNELLNSISLKSNDLIKKIPNNNENDDLSNLKVLLGQFINYSEKILREINNSEKKYQNLESFMTELTFSIESQSKEIALILSIIQNLDKLNKNNINIAQDISLRTKTLHKKSQEFNDIIEHLVLQKYFDSKK
jgi:methyl-accepting chemotaxis protein